MRTIYLDYNATTPLDPGVRQEMLPFLDHVFGNPSSVHRIGREARAHLDCFHERVAQVWGCSPSEVVFTSGGTESNNMAILGSARLLHDKGRHIITSSVEHHAVLNCCRYLEAQEGFSVTYLAVDSEGRVSPDDVRRAIRQDTILVSIMSANNEIGTIQPVSEIGLLCRDHGILFHTDAVQSLGKIPFHSIHQFEANLVSSCAHKIHGPKGAGALFVRSPLRLIPSLFGGPQEAALRPGTENLAAIAGFSAAVERFVSPPVFSSSLLSPLTNRLLHLALSIEAAAFRGATTDRLCNTVGFTIDGCDSFSLLANLDLCSLCASSGSACSSGSLFPSHVLLALGLPPSLASSFIRLSLGRDSCLEDVIALEQALPTIVRKVRDSHP